MKKILSNVAGALFFGILGAIPTHAAPIVGKGNPLSEQSLVGGTQFTFDEQGGYDPYSRNGVTISGPATVSSEYANAYNTTGPSLTNYYSDRLRFAFTFATPVSAFAFNFGGLDQAWTLSAFSGSTLVDTLEIPRVFDTNQKNYFGIAGRNITSATLVNGRGDWVFIDNFTFGNAVTGAVPEPATWAMLIAGFGFVGGAMRRRALPLRLPSLA